MRKFYCYILIGIITALLFPTIANAAVTSVSGTASVGNNETVTIVGKTFSGEAYTSAEQTDLGYDYTWTINQNFEVQGLTRNHYYSGTLAFRVNYTSSYTTTKTLPIIENTYVAPGLHVFIDAGTANYYSVICIFDNYRPTSVYAGLPTISQDFVLHNVDPPSYPQTMNITYSFSNASGSLVHKETPYDYGVAEVITSSIDNSTALAVIAGWLYDIKEADYTYYQGLVSNISSVLSAQNITNQRLQSLLNEIDLDFEEVQTILDLFPSYRTQVLQYWQELLQMNAAQSSQAAEMESEYANRDNQSDQLLGGLDSMQFPTISSGDLNVLKNVDSEGKANFFGLISLITNNSLVTNILLIVVTGMIAGYALYGKKS